MATSADDLGVPPTTPASEGRQGRKLGDEWKNWSGEAEERGGDLTTTPWVFLGALGISFLGLSAGLALFWYLIEPRLASLAAWAGPVSGGVLAAFLVLLWLWYISLLVTVQTGRNLLFWYRTPITGSTLLPWALRIGQRLGFSTDRLRNSLLQVQNRLVLARTRGNRRLLILAPRCLSKAARETMGEITARYGVEFFTAGGGTVARRLVAEKRPNAIVAVACERDLLAGVQDLKGRIPVIAVANKRPEGPCKGTHIDYQEFEEAVRFFLQDR